MGILDLFGGGGNSAEKAVKLKAKVTQKYGDPATRQNAITQLGKMKVPEAVSSLLARFTITVEPATTDTDEKEHTFELIKAFGKDALPPIQEFLRRSDHATSWALRLLSALQTESEVVGSACQLLDEWAKSYSRDPLKKTVVIGFLEGKTDARIAPAVLPMLEDMTDDVKIGALKTLGPHKYEPAREPILKLLTAEDTGRRVQTAAIAALHEGGFGVQGYREKVEALLSEPYFLDKAGAIKKSAG